MSEWQPIETAPKGGEWFIARTIYGTTRVVHYADEYDRFPISHDGVAWPTPPVEWTPLAPILSAITARPEAEVRATPPDVMALVEALRGIAVLHEGFCKSETDTIRGPAEMSMKEHASVAKRARAALAAWDAAND